MKHIKELDLLFNSKVGFSILVEKTKLGFGPTGYAQHLFFVSGYKNIEIGGSGVVSIGTTSSYLNCKNQFGESATYENHGMNFIDVWKNACGNSGALNLTLGEFNEDQPKQFTTGYSVLKSMKNYKTMPVSAILKKLKLLSKDFKKYGFNIEDEMHLSLAAKLLIFHQLNLDGDKILTQEVGSKYKEVYELDMKLNSLEAIKQHNFDSLSDNSKAFLDQSFEARMSFSIEDVGKIGSTLSKMVDNNHLDE